MKNIMKSTMIRNQRDSNRLEVKNGIAKTADGVFQIINLNQKGLLIKCFKRWFFSREWSLDIYDTSGLSIEQLHVKKIWERYLGKLDARTPFSMIIGVEFKNLSSAQKSQLNSYIQQLEGPANNI